MFVYPGLDYVSSKLADPKLRTWEQYELSQVKYGLDQQLPTDRAAASSSSSPQQRLLFVDVGANVGVFALNAARLGARVYAFEGMCIAAGTYMLLTHTWLDPRIAAPALCLRSSGQLFCIPYLTVSDGHTVMLMYCSCSHGLCGQSQQGWCRGLVNAGARLSCSTVSALLWQLLWLLAHMTKAVS
jgi:hypothetical protein